jgi:O-antigen ligase
MVPTTGSRAGLLLATLAMAMATVIAWPALRRLAQSLSRRQRTVAVGIGAVLLAAVLTTALTFARAEAVRRLFDSDPVDDARVRLLPSLIAMIRDFFPVGSGFGSFDPVYRGYEPFENLALTVMNQAHNDYLQIILEAGLPGLALILTFIGWWGWTSITVWTKRSGQGAAYGRLGSSILLLVMLASVVDYPLRTPLMMVIATQSAVWMLMAAADFYLLGRPRGSFSQCVGSSF